MPNTAAFIGQDTSTEGSWFGVYGADGYKFALTFTSVTPSYLSTFTSTKQTGAAADTFSWATNQSDVRALQNPASPGSNTRAAFTWYSNTTGTPQWVQLQIAVGATPRNISVYMIDWDSTTRAQTIDIIDADTGTVLDTRTIAAGATFHAGIWMRWTVTGNIKIRATKTGAQNPVISAIMFDTPPASGSAAGWWMM